MWRAVVNRSQYLAAEAGFVIIKSHEGGPRRHLTAPIASHFTVALPLHIFGGPMTRQLISSGSTFEQEIGYSRAVVDGDWVFISGTTGFDYTTMSISDTWGARVIGPQV